MKTITNYLTEYMNTGIRLDYKELRTISPKAARQAIIQILASTKGNVKKTADLLHTTRKTIYKALSKQKAKNLDDISTAPHTVKNKTGSDVEKKVVELKEKTNYGPIRLKDELHEQYGIDLSHHTVRNIVRRNKRTKTKQRSRYKRSSRPFIDWYTSSAFEVVQIDLKHIIDQKALSPSQIAHIIKHDLPLYQWGAVDVNSRFKLIAYSKEKSWTNGLTWFLWVTSWLRSHEVRVRIVYTVDHGQEFGGDCWYKIVELRKLLKGFGCFIIQNRKRHPEENAHLERSHKTDDDEFYIPRIHTITTQDQFYKEAFNYLYYYNCVRKHSSIGRISPYEHLRKTTTGIDDTIKYVPPIFLDEVSAKLGAWSGYHVLAQYHMERTNFRKSAWIYIQNEKVLVARSKGNSVFFLPGGGPENEETGKQALIREVREELTGEIIENTVTHVGTFEAPSYEFPETVSVQMDCYTADYKGTLTPSSEIKEIAWFSYKDKNKVSKVDGVVFDYLKAKRTII